MTVFVCDNIQIDSEFITIEDMPNEMFKEIFSICGVDTALSLLVNMPGNLIIVPSRGLLNIQKKILLKNYNGTTASLRKIARDFKIPQMTLRRFLNECKVDVPHEDQLGLPLTKH